MSNTHRRFLGLFDRSFTLRQTSLFLHNTLGLFCLCSNCRPFCLPLLSPLCMLMHIPCQVSSATPSPTLLLNLSCVKNTTMIFSLTLYLLSVSRFFFQMTRFLRVEIGHRESLGVRARGSISSLSQKFQLQVSVLVTWG